jgi:hypothetical protein
MSGNDTLDDDNPMWTRADFERARPTSDVLGMALAQSLQRPTTSLRQALSSQSWLLVSDRLAA